MKRVCVGLMALALGGCVTAQERLATIETGAPVELTAAELASVQSGVRRALKDPESAHFGRIAASRDSSGVVTACGYVNARNSFGGYVGEQPFAGILHAGVFGVAGIANSEASYAAIQVTCQKAGIVL